MRVMRVMRVMRPWMKGFFWGAPSHKAIAWVGALAGVGVLALGAVIAGKGRPIFILAVVLVGLAEFGWAAELLPRKLAGAAGWVRLARWLCAVMGAALSMACLAWGLTPAAWLGAVFAVTGVLLAIEMAPAGPANQPRRST